MRFARLAPVSLVFLAALFACGGCRTSQTTSAANAQPPAGSSSTEPPPNVTLINPSVVVTECPDAKTMNIRMARDAIRKLVDPCAAIPGGKAHFLATFDPNGTISLASPSGDPGEGIVPTCVLRNSLVHKVALRAACKFDVQLEERPTPGDGGT